MPVPKEYQPLCPAGAPHVCRRAPGARRYIAYTIHGDQITITELAPPAYPELNSAWSATRIAQLRYNDPEKGLWRIYLPVAGNGGWKRYDHSPAHNPEALLTEIAEDPGWCSGPDPAGPVRLGLGCRAGPARRSPARPCGPPAGARCPAASP